jgi:outer membrane protein assembly factor BamB
VVAKVAGRDQLLLTGCDLVASYDPNTGKPLWSTEATTSATAGTMVWSGDLVFGSGGWPKAGTFAVRADGSAKVVWQNPQKCYEQSMLAHEGHVYAIADSGVVFCWDATDGSEKWNARVSGKPSSSPVLAGGNLYIADERGTTTVFRADPKEYKEVARNRLGDEALATPAFCGGRIYARVAKTSGGKREEFLYCIGKDAR